MKINLKFFQILLIAILFFFFSTNAIAQDILNKKKYNNLDSLFLARGYSSWNINNEKEGVIRFTKNVIRPLIWEDIKRNQKNWIKGQNRLDERFTSKGIGKLYSFSQEGMLDANTLNEIIPPIYREMDLYFTNGLLLGMMPNNRYYLINKFGQIQDSSRFNGYQFIDKCNCNYYNYDEGFRKFIDIKNKLGFFDKNWNIVIPALYEQLSEQNVFRFGKIPVKLNGKIGILDNKGEFSPIAITNISAISDFNKSGFAVFTIANKMGVLDKSGKVILPAVYDFIRIDEVNYHENANYWYVKNNNKQGVFGIDGQVIIPIKYDFINREYSSDNPNNYFFSVMLKYPKKGAENDFVGSKSGLFDSNGKMLVPVIYNKLQLNFLNQTVYLDDKEYKLDKLDEAQTKDVIVKNNKTKNTNVPSGIIDGVSQQDLLNALFADDLKPSSQKSNNSSSSSSNSKQLSNTSEKKCTYCWKRQKQIRRFDLAKDIYVEDRGDTEMRPGSVLCKDRCGGSGRIVEGAFSSKSLRVCNTCKGSGWIKCNNCKGTGFVK